jgi:xanthine dehydrogenase small subunit
VRRAVAGARGRRAKAPGASAPAGGPAEPGGRARDAAAIRFALDGGIHVVEGISPATTVLQYLRERLRRTGTKEGCAEGDCGACTVVVAELAGAAVRYRATNACIQFLPTLDGKALLTVESLKAAAGGVLHPVQQALVECHGSQCGFCTPGFVMSLFALERSNAAPSDEDIRYALAGNLCRCTGYRPILAAARRMYALEGGIRAQYERALKAALRAIRVTREKRLAAPDCRYAAPVTVTGLARLLEERPAATLLAGGTDVGLWVTKQQRDLADVIYLGNVAGLERVEKGADRVEIGAAVTLTDAFAVLLEEYPDLREIVRRFASPPICNAGTLCGNIANGSPIGDSMPALICLGATVVLRAGEQVRELPLEDFYLGYRRTALARGEFVAAVHVPRARAALHFRSYKVSRRYDQDISGVCAAFAVELSRGRIRSARVCFGAMAPVPRRAGRCEAALRGARLSAATIEKAVRALASDYEPITDLRAGREYRIRVAGNLLRRFHAEVTGSASASVWDHGG